MKSTLLSVIMLLMALCSHADEIKDVKKAFAIFQEYQRTDDIRSLDLFTTNCTATFILTTPTASATNVLSGNEFRTELSRQISMKQGNKDGYQEVGVVKVGDSVRLKCKVRFASSGQHAALSLSYVRGPDGGFLIREMTVVMSIAAPQPASGTSPR
jgi:hypothetical protein